MTLTRPARGASDGRRCGGTVFLGVGGEGAARRTGCGCPASCRQRRRPGGLREGDVLVRIDERALNSLEDMLAALSTHRSGDQVRLRYLRDGLEHDTAATLDARP